MAIENPDHAIEIDIGQQQNWSISAKSIGGNLKASLWYGEIVMSDPCITMEVRPTSGGQYAEALDASMAGIALLPKAHREKAVLPADDIERCFAWAWIEMEGPQVE